MLSLRSISRGAIRTSACEPLCCTQDPSGLKSLRMTQSGIAQTDSQPPVDFQRFIVATGVPRLRVWLFLPVKVC